MFCVLCFRSGKDTFFEKHHLVPNNNKSETITVCHQCGDQLHLMFENRLLKTQLSSVDLLRRDDKMTSYIKWVRNKPLESKFSIKKKKRK